MTEESAADHIKVARNYMSQTPPNIWCAVERLIEAITLLEEGRTKC